MKLLKGDDLVNFIKVRQAQQVRRLRQAHGVQPKLVIFSTTEDPIIEKYIRLKQKYGEDILVEVCSKKVEQIHLSKEIEQANEDTSVQGIIVQLPLSDPSQTSTILNQVVPYKDVDGLAENSLFEAATPTAINWLLAGYNIDLRDKRICIIGQGRLVGAPLARLWKSSDYNVVELNRESDLGLELKHADIIVSAAGQPRLLTSAMAPIGSVLVDAGSSDEEGKQVGDFAEDIYDRDDLTLTPKIGGVGPLTVAALFDNVIKASFSRVDKN